MSLDNNRTERATRGFGPRAEEPLRLTLEARNRVRRVFYYSLIESAKLVAVEPAEYLRRAAETVLAGGEPINPEDLAPGCA